MVQSSTRRGLVTDLAARLSSVLERGIANGEAPGAVALVSRNGDLAVETAGTLTDGGFDPIGRDTIFRISSMTKPITAVAAMILVEECLIRLDDPVDHVLPELANRQVLRQLDSELDDVVPVDRSIRVRDLLTFTLGFGMVMDKPGPFPVLQAVDEFKLGFNGAPGGAESPAPDEWMRRLGTLPLMHQPGERWLYNAGSDILGVLIERAAGQALETFMRERIFGPLGMVDTGFSVPPEKIQRFPPSYMPDPGSGAMHLFDSPDSGHWSTPPAFLSGSYGLVSTVDDFHAFARMLLNLGTLEGTRILSRPSVETILTDHLTPEQKRNASMPGGYFESHGWGFGVGISTCRETLTDPVGSYGWDGGLGTLWRNDPNEDLVVIKMSQAAWTSPEPPTIARDTLTLAYASIHD